jgi:hypothetical protein
MPKASIGSERTMGNIIKILVFVARNISIKITSTSKITSAADLSRQYLPCDNEMQADSSSQRNDYDTSEFVRSSFGNEVSESLKYYLS